MHSTQWVCFITAVGIVSLMGFATVTAFGCSFGREPDPQENGIIRWVMPLNHRLRCQCTSIYPGGMNTYTPERGFYPFYTDHPLFTDLDTEIFNFFDCENCSLTCVNGGKFIDDPCHCSCAQNWTGKTCTECALTECKNGGTFDATTCMCTCPKQWMGIICAETRHYDCQDYLKANSTSMSGVYTIYTSKYPRGLDVYCNMKNWKGSIVIQKRVSGDLNFTRGWDEYKKGFGDLSTGSFWLGNEKVRQLTEDQDTKWEIQVKVRNSSTTHRRWRSYKLGNFRLSGENYTIQVDGSMDCENGKQSGAILSANGKPFTTYDKDNDGDEGINCVDRSQGGWWFDGCDDGEVNLNAEYTHNGISIGPRDEPLYITKTRLKIKRMSGET
ncbi:angiopoietin-4-like [Asterias amurensis]|uniref:angiopoietin-4-like n=1 Tax=Asterias amurensis TaxID=7602 RepID=UPI003AB7938E